MKQLVIKLLLPKLVRQGIAALGGIVAANGIAPDATNLPALATGAALFLISALWSWATKSRGLTGEPREAARRLVEAAVSQGIAFFAGWLSQNGFTGDPQSTEAVAVFLANYGVSAATRPDEVKSEKGKVKSSGPLERLKRGLPLLVCGLLAGLLLPGCETAAPKPQDEIDVVIAGRRAALIALMFDTEGRPLP